MSNLSRRLLKEGLERAAKRGAEMVKNEEINVGEVVHTLIKTVRSATGTAAQKPVHTVLDDHRTQDDNRTLTETLLKVARSVESVHDLSVRVRSHRGEFADFARTSRHQLVSLLSKLTEPVDNHHGRPPSIPSSFTPTSSEEGEGVPPSKDV